ncbi:hypothetical protein C6501_01815 [Candidatus Poribacteria bacterium]|nr:MAG: hypothetical protein C6501_01815 [Candidatus Poribacteria bacterium]
MNGTEKVVKHLEMIQAVIKRMAINSLFVKGASLLLVITSQVLFVSMVLSSFQKDTYVPKEKPFVCAVAAVLVFFILGFWILDGFFLWLERLFRYHYDAVRQQEDTDFNMNVGIHNNKSFSNWGSAIFSTTLVIFYTIEIIFILFLPAVLLFSEYW